VNAQSTSARSPSRLVRSCPLNHAPERRFCICLRPSCNGRAIENVSALEPAATPAHSSALAAAIGMALHPMATFTMDKIVHPDTGPLTRSCSLACRGIGATVEHIRRPPRVFYCSYSSSAYGSGTLVRSTKRSSAGELHYGQERRKSGRLGCFYTQSEAGWPEVFPQAGEDRFIVACGLRYEPIGAITIVSWTFVLTGEPGLSKFPVQRAGSKS
jgi:hypothetical protein